MVHFRTQLAVASSVAALVAASPVDKKTSVLVIPVEKRHKSPQYLAQDIVSRDQSRLARYHERAAASRGEKMMSERAVMSSKITNEDVT